MIEVNINKQITSPAGSIEINVEHIFQSGAVTRIAGPSGVGKTSFLKMLAGIITPDEGVIRVDGELWFDSKSGYSKKIQERKVGFVFQDYALFPNMTVEQHLYYGTKDPKYISSLLQLGELEKWTKSFPRQLSGGQQQRLSILRALCTRPKLLLMDEPFSALDNNLKSIMIGGLKALFIEQNTTVLLVTHQPGEMEDPETFTYLFE